MVAVLADRVAEQKSASVHPVRNGLLSIERQSCYFYSYGVSGEKKRQKVFSTEL